MDKKYDPRNLPKLFGVENLVTPKTLITEKDREIRRKRPDEAASDIRILLDEINIRVMSKDIVGICECIEAIQLRINYMRDVASEIRKRM